MARKYYTDFDSTPTEGDSLDSHMARICVQDNLEAVYEENHYDQTIIFPLWMDVATEGELIGSRRYVGPYIVPARKDRNGLFRNIIVNPICIGGDYSRTLIGWLMSSIRQPSTNQGWYNSWTVASGTTLAYQGNQTIAPLRSLSPHGIGFPRDTAIGRERGQFQYWYLLFEFLTVNGTNGPRFAGARIQEDIST